MSYLALDVGDRRIGVAGSDPEGLVVTPLSTIHRKSARQAVAAIAALAAERGADTLVVGLPYTREGTVGEQAAKIQTFARRLTGLPGVRVLFWNERYTTLEAAARLREAGPRRRRGNRRVAGADERDRLDAVAAAVILQDYLDEQRPSLDCGIGPGPLLAPD